MAKQQKAREANPKEFKEVVEFIDAKNALEEFKEEHKEVFDYFQELAEKYNAALENADQVVRSNHVTCGPFNLYSFTTKYNAERLYELIGRDPFIALGGTLGQETTYEIDKARYDAAVAQNKVTAEVDEQVRTMTPNFHKPKPLKVQ